MSFKPRIELDEIKILRFLNLRMKLAEKDKQRYHNLVKGYEGEVIFDALTEKLQCPSLILSDLLLEANSSTFKLDSAIIFQEKIKLFEVKNYEGDYYFEDGKFYTLSKKEILNPLHQLERAESLLRKLLQSLGFKIPIEAYVVFINPSFYLYQAPLNKPIIYSNQLPQFMKNMNNMLSSSINSRHIKLAEKLVSLHHNELPYDRLSPYEYGQLKKGPTCKVCNSFSMSLQGNKFVCDVCGCEELVASAVLRIVEEIKLLFPGRKITTNEIHEWCGVIGCKKRITRILRSNYSSVGAGQWTFGLIISDLSF